MEVAKMNKEQIKELSSLLDWLNTFDVFNFENVNSIEMHNNPEMVVERLSSPEVTRAISRVAEEICEAKVDLQTKASKSSGTDRVWTSLLMLTSTRARPLSKHPNKEDSDTRMSPARLKLYVLSNLLDCAVQSPNMQRRRQYIERIMALNKSVQKTLMSLIERRGKNTPKKRSPPRTVGSSSATPPKSALRQRRSLTETPQSSLGKSPRTPQSTHSHHQYPIEQSESNTSMATPIQSNVSPERNKSRRPLESMSSTGYTPDTTRGILASPYIENKTLSPGTLDSPGKMQMVFRELRSRIAKYESYMDTYKEREHKLQGKLEMIEGRHRNEMMRLEKQSLDREEELEAKYKNLIDSLTNQLQDFRSKATRGEQAIKELQKAKEEIEVLNQNQGALPEMSEKLRKYKERMNELQDIKDALRREQEAHGNAVDEIVRLENELQTLAPLKRQLEDYKNRAIEAEVKLADTQDTLEKLEQKAMDQSSMNESLWKGAILQKEQVEELRRRIQEDAKTLNESGPRIGEGMSELNPQIMEELYRLRNENTKLRDFAEKRSNDSVQQMADELDDMKRLSDKYKKEYLSTKEKLDISQQTCLEVEEREKKLVTQVNQLVSNIDDLRRSKEEVDERCETLDRELASLQGRLHDSEKCNTDLRIDLDQWRGKFNNLEDKSGTQSATINELNSEIERVKFELANSTRLAAELQALVAVSEEKTIELQRTIKDLEETLSESNQKLGQSDKNHQNALEQVFVLKRQLDVLLQENSQQLQSIEELQKSRQDITEEAQRTLESTREVLESKFKKEIDELENEMNKILDNERKARKISEDEANAKLESIEAKWRQEYQALQEKSTTSLNEYRESSQEHIESLKQEYEVEIAMIKERAKEDKEKLVRKGKAMIAETKSQAKQEIDSLLEKCQDLELQLQKLTTEKDNEKDMLQGKIASLKNHLEFSTAQVNELTSEVDMSQEKIRSLERENFELREDNDRCRRQLRGTGFGGQFQSQLEKLQKEYTVLLEENKELKKSSRFSHSIGIIPESIETEFDDDEQNNYGRTGGMTNEKLKEIKHEYDAHISNLVDEKRELLMKNYSASIDIEKAERRASEKEDEIARLKEEITSLKLQIQRQELISDDTVIRDALQRDCHTNDELDIFGSLGQERATIEILPHRTPPRIPLRQYEESSPHQRRMDISSMKNSKTDTPSSPGRNFDSEHRQRSPSVMKAMKDKQEYEKELRQRLQLLTGTSRSPPRVTFQDAEPSQSVLAPTLKHQQQLNKPDESRNSLFRNSQNAVRNEVTMKDDKGSSLNNVPSTSMGIGADYKPFRKNLNKVDEVDSETNESQFNNIHQPSLMDYTKVEIERKHEDDRPECKQS